VVAVKTADCIPLLLVDPGHRAVAAVHAGWRGTVAGIAQSAVAALGAHFGSLAGDLRAAIGPAIGKCCYEVGAEVAAQFGMDGRAHIDLAETVRRQLEAAGVGGQRITCPASAPNAAPGNSTRFGAMAQRRGAYILLLEFSKPVRRRVHRLVYSRSKTSQNVYMDLPAMRA